MWNGHHRSTIDRSDPRSTSTTARTRTQTQHEADVQLGNVYGWFISALFAQSSPNETDFGTGGNPLRKGYLPIIRVFPITSNFSMT